jgi:hypothetical protein
MKRVLVMLVTVVLSLPLVSFGGSESSIGHTKSAVSNSKSNSNNSGTLTVAPSTTSTTGDQTGSNEQSTSTATASVISVQASTQPSGLNAPGFGNAIIDGFMSPGEWDNAVKIDFLANVPSSDGGGTTPATLYIMNDGLNLYLAVKIARSSFGSSTQLFSDFDNNNDGIMEDGEDGFWVTAANNASVMFVDTYLFNCPASATDPANCTKARDTDATKGILPAGTNDGTVAANNDGSVTIIELSHLLNSKDTLHDFSLKPGNKVGFYNTLRLFSIAPADRSGLPYVDTKIPASGEGQITIASPVFTRVIDLKPGGRENSVNRNSEGKVLVAILSTDGFDAPGLVVKDRTSLTFGRKGDEKSLAFCNEASVDVNGDGIPDLLCHFSTQLAGFQSGDTVGILNGQTTDGARFTAQDSVRIVR